MDSRMVLGESRHHVYFFSSLDKKFNGNELAHSKTTWAVTSHMISFNTRHSDTLK